MYAIRSYYAIVVEHNHKFVFPFMDVNIRIDILRGFFTELAAGFGFKALNRNNFV